MLNLDEEDIARTAYDATQPNLDEEDIARTAYDATQARLAATSSPKSS